MKKKHQSMMLPKESTSSSTQDTSSQDENEAKYRKAQEKWQKEIGVWAVSKIAKAVFWKQLGWVSSKIPRLVNVRKKR